MYFKRLISCLLSVVFICSIAYAQEQEEHHLSRLQKLKNMMEVQRENKQNIVSEESLGAVTANTHEDAFGGRDMLVYVPMQLPAMGQRALLIALHGGGGNALFMQQHLKMDGVAEKNGFIVAYLNGSAAAKIAGGKMKAWNAGKGCCGKPYADKVDDIAYITDATHYLQQKYGADPARTFGVGHSNGAMMMQTLACETNLYAKVATLAGTMMAETPACASARGHTIYDYHGADDANVPIAGGYGTKGVTDIDYTSQAQAKTFFENAGGRYVLQVFPGADHAIEHISAASQTQDGVTIAERIARDLGLSQ